MAIAGAKHMDGQPAARETIYFNAKVYTVDDALGTQSAFLVRGDRIAAVGSDESTRYRHLQL